MAFASFRWIIAALGMYVCALLYGQRAAMSLAIVAMTQSASQLKNGHLCNRNTSAAFSGNFTVLNSADTAEFTWNAKLQVTNDSQLVCVCAWPSD